MGISYFAKALMNPPNRFAVLGTKQVRLSNHFNAFGTVEYNNLDFKPY